MDKKQIEHAVEIMENSEILRLSQNVLQHSEYLENEFTGMVVSICKFEQIEKQQKAFLKQHLILNHKLWY